MKEIHMNRRRFLSTLGVTLGATQLGIFGFARAHGNKTNSSVPVTFVPQGNTSFDTLKQIDAGVLNVGYAEAGPSDGPARTAEPMLSDSRANMPIGTGTSQAGSATICRRKHRRPLFRPSSTLTTFER